MQDVRQGLLKLPRNRASGAITAEEWQRGLALLAHLEEQGTGASAKAYGAVIGACGRSARWLLGLELLASLLARRVQQDVTVCTAAMRSCGLARQWRQALALLSQALACSLQVDLIAYNTAASALERGSQWQRVLELLQDLEAASCPGDKITFSSAMGACGKQGLWQTTLHLLESMQRMHVQGDLRMYTAVISACGAGRRWREAVGLLTDFGALSLQPDVVAYTAAIQSCTQGTEWEQALSLMNQMLSHRLQADLFMYNSIMNAGVEGKQWLLAVDLLRSLRGSLQGDAYTYSICLCAFECGGQWKQAVALVDSLGNQRLLTTAVLNSVIPSLRWSSALAMWALLACRNLKPDGITPVAIFGACEKGGKWRQATTFLLEMDRGRLKPTLSAYTAAMGACKVEASEESWLPALLLLTSLRHRTLQGDDVSTNYVMASCAGSGRWAEALAVPFEEDVDISTCNTRIGACAKWQDAIALYNAMLRSRLTPDLVSYSTAIGACKRGEQWLQALVLLAELKGTRQVDAMAYTATIGACAGGAQWQIALCLLAEACSFRVPQDDVIIASAAGACVRATRWELALDFLQLGGAGKMTVTAVLNAYLGTYGQVSRKRLKPVGIHALVLLSARDWTAHVANYEFACLCVLWLLHKLSMF